MFIGWRATLRRTKESNFKVQKLKQNIFEQFVLIAFSL